MEVRIGDTIIQDAEVKRFIELKSGLPLSMIKVSHKGEPFQELREARAQIDRLLPFECAVIKTNVIVHDIHSSREKREVEYVLQERYADVPCGYKLIHTEFGNETAIIVPENTKYDYDVQGFRNLPFIRFILKKDMPKDLLE